MLPKTSFLSWRVRGQNIYTVEMWWETYSDCWVFRSREEEVAGRVKAYRIHDPCICGIVLDEHSGADIPDLTPSSMFPIHPCLCHLTVLCHNTATENQILWIPTLCKKLYAERVRQRVTWIQWSEPPAPRQDPSGWKRTEFIILHTTRKTFQLATHQLGLKINSCKTWRLKTLFGCLGMIRAPIESHHQLTSIAFWQGSPIVILRWPLILLLSPLRSIQLSSFPRARTLPKDPLK